MWRRLHLGLLGLLLVLNGCVISPRRDGSGGSGSGGGGGNGAFGRIYVTNPATNTLVRFDGALTVNGNVAPGVTISGAATLLSTPQYLFLDTGNNRLFIANQGGSNILVFDNANGQTGNAPPTRTISGPATKLFTPVDVALDRTRDLLYVADSSSGIVVFANGSNASGNATPLHTLSLSFVSAAIFIDGANNRLFVADNSNNAIQVFDGAAALDGAVTANRIIAGVATQLNQPAGLQVDNAGRLIVSNFNGGSVTIYSNAAAANGNVGPVATISGGNTGILAPTQLTLNNATTTGDLYLADGAAGAVLIFANLGSANGNTSATRSISGSNTGLQRSSGGVGPLTAKGIALDTTR